VLREAFLKYNTHHDTYNKVIAGGMFAAYWPLTYALSRTVRPSGVLVFTLFYYFGLYQGLMLKFSLKSF